MTIALVVYFGVCITFVFHAIYREKKMLRERDAIRRLYEIELEKTRALEAELKKLYSAKVFLKIPRAQIDNAMLN